MKLTLFIFSPTGGTARVDSETCIGCMRCVALCPQKARVVAPEQLAGLAAKLEKACAGRRENELFL